MRKRKEKKQTIEKSVSGVESAETAGKWIEEPSEEVITNSRSTSAHELMYEEDLRR